MKIRLISFTGRGQTLAEDLAEKLGGEAQRCGHPLSISEWTRAAFLEADALVFVGAAGIAVRAVAPYLAGKDRDPAVVAVDEAGRFAVPLLSGHLGGANDLAGRIAACCGAQAVITTATDVNGVFAADLWARHQGCAVLNVGKIKEVSSRLLSGGTVAVKSDWQIAGDPPDGVRVSEDGACDVRVTVRREKEGPLLVVPKILVLGIGCRKDTPLEKIERAFQALLEEEQLFAEAFALAATIDRKGEEPGLLAFCEKHGLPLRTFTSQQLQETEGDFSASAFVREITGTDNVCERSAVCAGKGALIVKKRAADGVTCAVAQVPFAPDWR